MSAALKLVEGWTDPTAAERLRFRLAERGDDLLAEPGLCRALLADDLPGRGAEIEALVRALEQGVPQRLRAAGAAGATPATLDSLAAALVEHRALLPAAARWAVASWAVALGMAPAARLADPAPAVGTSWARRGAASALGRGKAADAPARLAAAQGLPPAERHLLRLALAAGIPGEIERASAGPGLGAALDRLAARLAARHALLPEAARWAVDGWAVAVGRLDETGLRRRATTQSEPPPIVAAPLPNGQKARPSQPPKWSGSFLPRLTGLRLAGAGVALLVLLLTGVGLLSQQAPSPPAPQPTPTPPANPPEAPSEPDPPSEREQLREALDGEFTVGWEMRGREFEAELDLRRGNGEVEVYALALWQGSPIRVKFYSSKLSLSKYDDDYYLNFRLPKYSSEAITMGVNTKFTFDLDIDDDDIITGVCEEGKLQGQKVNECYDPASVEGP